MKCRPAEIDENILSDFESVMTDLEKVIDLFKATAPALLIPSFMAALSDMYKTAPSYRIEQFILTLRHNPEDSGYFLVRHGYLHLRPSNVPGFRDDDDEDGDADDEVQSQASTVVFDE